MIINGGGGWKIGLIGLAVSVGIFAVLYFTVIKPTTDTANDAIRNSLRQSQQQLKQAKKTRPRRGQATAEPGREATACLQDAGIDTSRFRTARRSTSRRAWSPTRSADES